VNARRVDRVDLLDRTGDLALQGALVVDLLDEVGDSEGRLIEDLVADGPAGQDAGPRDLDLRLVHHARRDADRSVVAQLVRNL